MILISGEFSGTVQSAFTAHGMLQPERQDRIAIIDSRSTVAGLGLQLLRAGGGGMLAQSRSIKEILEENKRIKFKQQIFFVVDNLEYLVRKAN